MDSILPVFVVLAAASAFFCLIEACFTDNPAQPRWQGRRGLRTDIIFLLFTPIVTNVLGRLGMAAIVVFLYQLTPADLTTLLADRDTWAGRQSGWLQILEILVIGDFIGYWMHRVFHSKALWSFHAVHHSSEDLDWLSGTRLHPVNGWVTRWMQGVILIGLGFSPLAVLSYIPILTFYAIFTHSNLDWDFGPFRKVFVSPRFHRWHHTSEAEGLDKNFAGFLPVFDIVFGTWYMPEGKVPRLFGLHGEQAPNGFIAQLMHPFRRNPASVETEGSDSV